MPGKQVMLVEGADDEHVVRHLWRCHRDGPLPFEGRDKKGFPQLKKAIRPEIKGSGLTSLGILVDANQRPARRWQEVAHQVKQGVLEAVGQPVQLPKQMSPTGTIVGQRLRVGIWLMPDNNAAGELEDFIEQLIPSGEPVWPRAQQYIDDIPEVDRKFKPDKIVRARIHAWLATRGEPRKMGAAIGIGDLDATALLGIRFTDWLQELFG